MREEANLPLLFPTPVRGLHASNVRVLGHQVLRVLPAAAQSWFPAAGPTFPHTPPLFAPHSSLDPQMQENALRVPQREHSDPREPGSIVETTTVKQRLYFIFKTI